MRQEINIGLSPNDKSGDPLRTGGDKINDNFIELYNAVDANTYRTTITPEVISIPADYDGSNPDLTNANSTIYVNTAIEDQSASWVWVVDTVTNCTANVTSNNIVNILTITDDSGVVSLTASNLAFPTVTLYASISVNRARQGEPGTVLVDDDTVRLNGSNQVEGLIIGRSITDTESGRFWYSGYEATRTLIAAEITSGSDEPQRQGKYSVGFGRYSLATGIGNISSHAGRIGGNPNTPYSGSYCLIIGDDYFTTGNDQGITGSGDYSVLVGTEIVNSGDSNIIVSSSTSTTTVTGDGNLVINTALNVNYPIDNSIIIGYGHSTFATSGGATLSHGIIRGTGNRFEAYGENSYALDYDAGNTGYKISTLLLGTRTIDDATGTLSLTGDSGTELLQLDTVSGTAVGRFVKYKFLTVSDDATAARYYWEEGTAILMSHDVLGSYTVVLNSQSDSGVTGGFSTTLAMSVVSNNLNITAQVVGAVTENFVHSIQLDMVHSRARA